MAKAARLTDTGSGHDCFPPSPVTSGSPDVKINGLPAARVGDTLEPHSCSCGGGHGSHPRTIVAGSSSVRINGRPAARTGDAIDCGGVLISGSGNVNIGEYASSLLAGAGSGTSGNGNRNESAAQPTKRAVSRFPLLIMATTPALKTTPVFAKSCLRGPGCTDAGTEEEPQDNFAPMSFYQSQPSQEITENEPVQYAQTARKKPAAPAKSDPQPPKENSLFDQVTGFFFGEAQAMPLPPPPAPVLGGSVEAGMAASAGGATGKLNQDAAKALSHQMRRLGGPETWQGQIAMNLPFVVMGTILQTMLKGEKRDLLTPEKLLVAATERTSVPTRVRYTWEFDEDSGRLKPVGYHTEAGSGRDQVKVRLLNKRPDGRYVFREDEYRSGPSILWTPSDAPGHTTDGWDTGNDLELVGLESVPGLEYPDTSDVRVITTPMPEEKDFRDYILVFPENEFPPIYIYLSKPPVEFLEVELYSEFKGRSRQGKYEADHMPSRAAVETVLSELYPTLSTSKIRKMSEDVASIVIPKQVHQKVSETYGGRNKPDQIKRDARDLRAAVDRNLDAIKPTLKSYGATDKQIEAARTKLHKLNAEMGLYK